VIISSYTFLLKLKGEYAIKLLQMNHFFLIGVLFFALTGLVPVIFRLFRPSPRDKARSVVEFAQKRGFALVNPAIAQALDNSLLQMLKNPTLRNSVRAASDVADVEELENGTGDWLAFHLHSEVERGHDLQLQCIPKERQYYGGKYSL